jgi:hypothetical protein
VARWRGPHQHVAARARAAHAHHLGAVLGELLAQGHGRRVACRVARQLGRRASLHPGDHPRQLSLREAARHVARGGHQLRGHLGAARHAGQHLAGDAALARVHQQHARAQRGDHRRIAEPRGLGHRARGVEAQIDEATKGCKIRVLRPAGQAQAILLEAEGAAREIVARDGLAPRAVERGERRHGRGAAPTEAGAGDHLGLEAQAHAAREPHLGEGGLEQAQGDVAPGRGAAAARDDSVRRRELEPHPAAIEGLDDGAHAQIHGRPDDATSELGQEGREVRPAARERDAHRRGGDGAAERRGRSLGVAADRGRGRDRGHGLGVRRAGHVGEVERAGRAAIRENARTRPAGESSR